MTQKTVMKLSKYDPKTLKLAIEKMLLDGLLQVDIANFYNVTEGTISKKIKKLGIDKEELLKDVEIGKVAHRKFKRNSVTAKLQKQVKSLQKQVTQIPVITPKDILIEIEDLVNKFPPFAQNLARVMVKDYYRQPTATKYKEIMKSLNDLDVLIPPSSTYGGLNPAETSYIRPTNLAPIQHLVMRIIDENPIVFLEGARRTRKTATVLRWDFEYGRELYFDKNIKHSKTIFIASQGHLAEAIHQDFITSEWSEDLKPHIKDHSAKKTLYYNGHRIDVRNTVPTDLKGSDTYVLVVDETDQVFLNNPKVIADAVACALTHDMHVIFMANRPPGEDMAQFRRFTRIFRTEDFWLKEMGCTSEMAKKIMALTYFITMEQADIPEMQTEEFDIKRTLVAGIQTVCVSKEYADSQMGNKDPVSGAIFPQKKLEYASVGYLNFQKNVLKGYPPFRTVMGIDPSGGNHPTGISIWGDFHGNMYEIFSQKITGVDNLDDDYIRDLCLELAIRHKVQYIVSESNSGGKKLIYWLNKRLESTVKCENQNFENEEHGRGPMDFVKVVRRYLNSEHLFILSADVESQFGWYKPHKSADPKHKGDVADAAIHAIWKLHLEREKGGNRSRGNVRRTGLGA